MATITFDSGQIVKVTDEQVEQFRTQRIVVYPYRHSKEYSIIVRSDRGGHYWLKTASDDGEGKDICMAGEYLLEIRNAINTILGEKQ